MICYDIISNIFKTCPKWGQLTPNGNVPNEPKGGNMQADKIIVEHVYKTFNVYLDKANTIKEKLLFFKRNRKQKREVLKDVNLKIKQGEVVALIGVNGSRQIYIA